MWTRRLLLIPAALAVAGVALATGFGGDNPPSRIPIPARDFSATVEDHGGVQVTVDRVSWKGEIFLYGTLGAAQITLPFDKIATVRFEKKDEETRVAVATTTDGDTVRIDVDEDTPCYGATKYGNYAIEAEDIRSITFHHSKTPPSE